MTNKNLKKLIMISAVISLASGLAFADGTEPVKLDVSKLDADKAEISKEKPESKKSKSAKLDEEPAGARVKLLQYDESNVYVIRTKYGYQTNIVFAPNEEIQTISVGDRSLWQLIPAGNRLFIRPMSENVTTNMTLLTNKHSYEFDLKSLDKDDESNIYVAKFVYTPKAENAVFSAPMMSQSPQILAQTPVTPPIIAKQFPQTQSTVNSGVNYDHVLKLPNSVASTPVAEKPMVAVAKPVINNYNYTYSGLDAIAPAQVYDNGKSTFINYQTLKKPLPEVFVVTAGGQEFLTTPVVQGNSLVVNDVAGEIVLRGNGGEIKIYNEALGQR